MDKKKLIATIAAISLSVGTVGFATACDNEKEPDHEHTYDTTQWVSEDGAITHWHPSTCEHKGLKDGEEPHIDEDGNKFCDKCDQDLRDVVAVTIAPTTGGTVTLDKTAPKEGETVTVTVTASEGYTLSSVKLGTEEKTLDANNKFTFTASAAVTITATFEAKTITLDASALNNEHGEVAFKFIGNKTEYKYGENVVLHVTEKGYYKLQSLYINGDTAVNYADGMSEDGDILIQSCNKEALTLTGTFVIGYKDIEVTFGGKRMGNDVVLGADSGVTVGGYDSVTVGADGKATLIKAEIGKSYVVGANGFNNGSFTVGDAAAYDVTLQWRARDCFTSNDGNRDLTHFNDGYLTSTTASSDIFLYTEKFIGDDAIFTVKFKTANFAAGAGSRRSYVGFMFGDKQTGGDYTWFDKQITALLIDETGNRRVEWQGGANFGAEPLHTTWAIKDSDGDNSGFYNHLPQSVLDKWDGNDGVELTIVRKDGRNIYAFVDGLYIGKCDLGEDYVGQLAAPSICAPATANGQVIPFTLTEGASAVNEYLSASGTVSTDSVLGGVTVTSNKSGECAFLEDVELTVTVPAGKKITSFEVDGNNVIGDLAFKEVGDENAEIYTYSFKMRKSGDEGIVVHAVTENVVLVNLDVTVKGKKLGVETVLPQNTVVTFKGSRYTFNVDANGKITQNNMAAGTYTVHVNGYFEKQITVGGDDPITEIVLDYETFKELLHWGEFDFSAQNADTPIIGATNDCMMIMTNDTYAADVMSTVYLNGDDVKRGNQGLLFRFVGEGLNEKGETVAVRMEGTQKVHFATYGYEWWGSPTVNAEGYGDRTLYAFSENDSYLNKYNAGTLKLSALRKGATIYVFLDDAYIGSATLASKYANARCEAGFIQDNTNNNEWKKWKIGITEDIPSVSITDDTEDTNGSIEIENTQNVKLGDVVTVNYTPASGFILDEITVAGGTDIKRSVDNSVTFVATSETVSVVATFKEGVEFDADVAKAVGMDNTQIDLNGKTLLFKPATGTAIPFVVENGKVHCAIAKGTYTVSVDEKVTINNGSFGKDNKIVDLYYDLTVTVGDNGIEDLTGGLRFTRRLLGYDLINEPLTGNAEVNDMTFATDGYITATTVGKVYEWSVEKYDDVAITVTLKSGNGNQGLIMCFDDTKESCVRVRIEQKDPFTNTKVQYQGDEWFWGTMTIHHNKWDFGSGEEYANPMNSTLLDKYSGDGLDLTLLRKGGMVYTLIDGKVYSAQPVTAYADKKVRVAMFAENATAWYQIPIAINTDVDDILASAGVAAGSEVTAYLGNWTEVDGTLAVSTNRGYAEFNAPAGTVKESATIHIKETNGGDQGLVYRFANGKYIAVRYQYNNGDYKIQYTMDTSLFNDGSLKSWNDWLMNDDEKATFDENGLDLRFVRDGKVFYTLLGDRVLDIATLDDAYATMCGAMGIMIWNGNNNAFAYSHKTGDAAVSDIPDVSSNA